MKLLFVSPYSRLLEDPADEKEQTDSHCVFAQFTYLMSETLDFTSF